MGNKKSPRSDLSALDSWFEHDEALGYRLTFVRSEISVADSNSLKSDSRVHIVYKLCRRLIKSLKTEFKRTAAARPKGGGCLLSGVFLFSNRLYMIAIYNVCIPFTVPNLQEAGLAT